jgi:CRP-like cAMP-binding protein/membrane protein YdbS with pleckstrin-like domain
MIPVEQLRQVPLFAPLDVEALAQIAPLFHHQRYQLGDIVFAQGAPGDAFYILTAGVLRVRQMDARGQEHVVDYYNAPRYFGETSLLTGIPHDTTAEVFSKEADLYLLPKNEWDTFFNAHPDIKAQLNIRADVQKKLAGRRFKWLGEGEYVVVQTRRHPYALLLMLRLPGIGAGALFLLVLIFTLIQSASPDVAQLLGPVGAILWTLFLLLLIGGFTWTLLDWGNDWLIITNKRVIRLERVIGLLEERLEAPIEQVTNVNETAQGLFARLLEFSDIRIETAGHQIDISFEYVPRRLHVRENVFQQIEQVKSRVQLEKRERMRAQIREELYRYITPPQVGTPVAPPRLPELGAPPPPTPIRQRRRSGLGKRLNNILGLQIEEQGRITWRKHWLDLLARTGRWLTIVAVILVLGPAILFATWNSTGLVQRLLFIALWSLALLFFGFLAWYNYEDWRNDIYQLTDERVLDIERSPFRLKERLVETTLERIQNVSYSKPNLIANLLNFGDLTIETAGGQGQLVFKKVSNPQWATQEIFRRRNAYRDRQQMEQARRNQADLLDWFIEYHRLLQQKGDVSVIPANPAPPPPETPPDRPPDAPPTQ